MRRLLGRFVAFITDDGVEQFLLLRALSCTRRNGLADGHRPGACYEAQKSAAHACGNDSRSQICPGRGNAGGVHLRNRGITRPPGHLSGDVLPGWRMLPLLKCSYGGELRGLSRRCEELGRRSNLDSDQPRRGLTASKPGNQAEQQNSSSTTTIEHGNLPAFPSASRKDPGLPSPAQWFASFA